MTLQQKLKRFGESLADLAPNVYHYHRRQKDFPCVIWQEEGPASFYLDDQLSESAPAGSLDYFTQEEFDPAVDEIELTLAALGISWRLNSIQYEEDTGLIHYEWLWEM